jgi:hypothetical protein
VPQDIPSASPAKNLPPKSKSPKVDKPPSPFAGKTFPEMSNALGPENINVLVGAASHPTSPSTTDSRHDAAHQSPRPDPIEPQELSPLSAKSFGLGAHGGPQPGKGSSVQRPEKQLRQYSCVVESMWDNPDFIQARFHIGQYVSASMNTTAEHE